MIRSVCFLLVFIIWPFHTAVLSHAKTTAPSQHVPKQGTVLTTNDIAASIEFITSYEESLISATALIPLFGQLMVISSKIDFSLAGDAPAKGFKHMRHPESFRASLVQASNDGWKAVMFAHKNTDRFQLSAQQIRSQIRSIKKVLTNPSTRAVQRSLSVILNRIQSIGQLAGESESNFTGVMSLLGELLQVTEANRISHDQKLIRVRMELNVTIEEKKMIEQLGQDINARQGKINAEVSKHRALYDEAVRQFPIGWPTTGSPSNGSTGPERKNDSAFEGLLNRTLPLAAETTQSAEEFGGDASSSYSCTGCSERVKANLQLEALKKAERRQDLIFQETMKYHEKMKELVSAMARLNPNETSCTDILALQTQGIVLLHNIRQQFGKLVDFFHLVSNRAIIALNRVKTSLLEFARAADEVGMDSDRRFYLGFLLEEVAEIDRQFAYMDVVSSTYLNVSSRFLVNSMALLPRMLAADGEQERERLLVQAWREADQAQDAIMEMARDRRQQSARVMQMRKEELQAIVGRLGSTSEIESDAMRGAHELA